MGKIYLLRKKGIQAGLCTGCDFKTGLGIYSCMGTKMRGLCEEKSENHIYKKITEQEYNERMKRKI